MKLLTWPILLLASAVGAVIVGGLKLWEKYQTIVNEEDTKDRDWEHHLDVQEDRRQADVRRIGLKPRP